MRRRRRSPVMAGQKTHISMSATANSFRKREPCINNVKWSTTNGCAHGRREAVSPLFTIITRRFCIRGSLSEKERDQSVSTRLPSSRSRLIPVYMTLGRGQIQHRKGIREQILLVGDLNDICVTESWRRFVFASLSDYDDNYSRNTAQKVSYCLFIQSSLKIFCQDRHAVHEG